MSVPVHASLAPALALTLSALAAHCEPDARAVLARPAQDRAAAERRAADIDPVVAVGSAYAAAQFDRRERDEWAALLAPDFAFVDPTADLWGAPFAEPIRGRDVFLRLQERWDIEASRLERVLSFRAGDELVLVGRLAWRPRGAAEQGPVGFATILRVEDRLVVGRRDYGDYDALGTTAPERSVEPLALAYLDSYARRALRELEPLVTHDVAFRDRAHDLAVDGRFELLAHLEAAGAAATRSVPSRAAATAADASAAEVPPAYEVRLSFASTSHALVAGEWTVAGGERRPFALALRFEDGRVSEHREWTATPDAASATEDAPAGGR